MTHWLEQSVQEVPMSGWTVESETSYHEITAFIVLWYQYLSSRPLHILAPVPILSQSHPLSAWASPSLKT
jgi:hypothetical protein